ncbi:MAG: hypothetical protein ABIP96_05955 [Patescibacteria group bacterium]
MQAVLSAVVAIVVVIAYREWKREKEEQPQLVLHILRGLRVASIAEITEASNGELHPTDVQWILCDMQKKNLIVSRGKYPDVLYSIAKKE